MRRSFRFIGNAVLAAVLAAVFSWSYVGPLMTRQAAIEPAYRQGTLGIAVENNEKTFPVPVPAHWEGRVFGVLEGGQAFAIRRPDGKGDFYAFFEDKAEILDGDVRIRGLWLGTTCAYRNTVFSGNCVPELKIKEFELLEFQE